MKTVDNRAAVLRRSYSAWALYFIFIGAALSVVSAVAPQIVPVFLSGWWVDAVIALLAVAGVAGRVMLQQSVSGFVADFFHSESGAVSKRAVGGGVLAAAVLAAATASIQQWEGTELKSYWDPYGAVWTACTGETRGIGPGMEFTSAECRDMLSARVPEFWGALDRCIPGFAAAPNSVQAASTSWAYNVGAGAACRSTLARKIAARDYKGACNELPRWNRAGGRILNGLTNRRFSERALCFTDL